MLCFTILGEHDALKSDKQDTAKVVFCRGETPTYDANRCRQTTLTCPPLGAGMLCFTILGEHDALKSDKQDTATVVQRTSETPTSDADRCRQTTLTCPPLGSWSAVFYNS